MKWKKATMEAIRRGKKKRHTFVILRKKVVVAKSERQGPNIASNGSIQFGSAFINMGEITARLQTSPNVIKIKAARVCLFLAIMQMPAERLAFPRAEPCRII